MYVQDTIVAAATPPGQGGVAIVRLSGPDALAILGQFWRPQGSLSAGHLRPRRLYLGEVRDPSTAALIDQALAVMMPAPRSLTGENVAEVHCHGGPYVVRRIVSLAIACGARPAEAGEFTRRAFLNGRMDLTQAEAIADLVAARGESALQQAVGQLAGALRERVGGLRERLIRIRAHLEAEIDFADEDITLPSRCQIAADIRSLESDLAVLHDSFERGRLLREGVRATILGKPNVGKSSVLNLLLGGERAIVTPIPGTTRDVIEDSIQLALCLLVLQDTAGIRRGGDEVEKIGVERTRRYVSDADLLIAVFDGSLPLEAEDLEVIELARGRPGVALLNKSDLPPLLSPQCIKERGLAMPILPFCALRPEGAGFLKDELAQVVELLAGDGQASAITISRERHRQALARARRALARASDGALGEVPPEIVAVDVTLACEALASMTGEVTCEEVLDAIFGEFCIGK